MAIQNATISFMQGVGGYAGVQDTQIHQGNASSSYGSASTLSVDGSPVQQGLLRFDDIFSPSAIPLGAEIVSATLTLQTTNAGNGGTFHRMLQSWSEASTWNSMSAGVSIDGVEAVQAADVSSGSQTIGTSTINVTSSVQAWANGAVNYGWLINSLGSNGWDFSTSEGSVSPRLTIQYRYDDGAPPPANTPPTAVNDSATVTQNGSVVINVLSNDTDANNDTLAVTQIAATPANGIASIGSDNRITYTPTPGFIGADSFSYTISDNRGGTSTATVTVAVNPPSPTPVEHVITFAQGVGGYAGIQDTQLAQSSANTNYGNVGSVIVDSSPNKQGLLRFDNIISSSGVPEGATIVSATLTLQTTNAGNGGAFHRMLKSWSEASTWNSMTGGISTDGVEAVQIADVSTGRRTIGTSTIDVTSSVQGWANGAANNGWLVKSLGSDAWYFSTSESSVSPILTVRYTIDNAPPPPPPVNVAPTANNDSATVTVDGSVSVNVLSNDTDPNNDTLIVTGINSQPAHGTVAIGADNKITYTPATGYAGSDSFIYAISDNRGGTSSATVNVDVRVPPPLQFSSTYGYVALSDAAGSTSNFEHTNASKTFFHDGTWWAILPETIANVGGAWSIYQYDETIPANGAQGGWSVASSALLSSSYHADIAFDEASGHLYALMFGGSLAPYLFDLSYNAQSRSWTTASSVNLATRLDPNVYSSNVDLALHVDQFGNPMIVAVNDGASKGLYLATAKAGDYSTWTSTLLDANTTSSGGSNGNSKADFVNFDVNGQKTVGIVYSQDSSSDSWRFAWHEASSSINAYTTNWQNETITTGVSIDDHVSARANDGKIYAVIKDASNALWLLSGSPGQWESPIRIVSGGQGTSRPFITLDETNDRIYVTYQQSTSPSDVYLKIADLNNPVFDATAAGMKIIQGNGSADKFINPQGPSHNVGSDTDGYFPIMVREDDGNNIWWNGISLGNYDLIA